MPQACYVAKLEVVLAIEEISLLRNKWCAAYAILLIWQIKRQPYLA